MFTVLCRHAHSDWQITVAFLYVIGNYSLILCKHGNILLSLTFYILLYTHCRNTYQQVSYL